MKTWYSPLRVLGALMLVGVVLLAACSGNSGSSNSSTKGGTIIIARQTDLSTLDPDRAFCDTCQIVLSATYQTLTTLKGGSLTDVVGELATSWTASSDVKTYTFHLNPKAVFADGTKVTSTDVAFSLLRLKNLQGGPSFIVSTVDTIATPDPETVVFHLNAADSALPYELMAPYCAILEAKVVKANGGSDAADAAKVDKAQSYLDTHTAGSGPYMLQSWTHNQEVRLAKNPKYWGPLSPSASTIVIQDVKDAATQRQLLERGDADVAMNIGEVAAQQMQSNKSVDVKFTQSYDFLYMEMNQTADPRLNQDVRQAFAKAIDYAGVIQATVGGHGIQPVTTIPQGFLGTNLGTPVKTDVAAAKALMAQGGFPNGFSIKLAYPNQALYGVDTNVLAQKVAADLAKIGVTVTLDPMEIGPWGTAYGGGKLPFTLGYWAPDYPDTSEYVAWFGPMGNPGTPSQWLGNIVNQQAVTLGNQALATTDSNQRAQDYAKIITIMQTLSYDVPLVQPSLVLASRSTITGNEYSPCCNLIVANLTRK